MRSATILYLLSLLVGDLVDHCQQLVNIHTVNGTGAKVNEELRTRLDFLDILNDCIDMVENLDDKE